MRKIPFMIFSIGETGIPLLYTKTVDERQVETGHTFIVQRSERQFMES